jgi:F0F1-type ATP synthase membrane subunit c/vacuolar-type H+-ATPase subunit K
MAQTETQTGVERRLQTMRVLWAVFLANIGLFALVGYLITQGAEAEAYEAADFSNLLLILFAVGVASVAASFAVRRVFQARAEREQNPVVVQTGLILALVMCEVAALLGLIGLFIDRNPYAYALFALAAVGDLLHFPRREQLLAASYKTAARNAAA